MNVKRLYTILFPAFGLLLSLCGPGPVDQNATGLTFKLKGPDAQNVSAGGTAGFTVEITNHGPDECAVICKKTNLAFPDTTWSSSLCIGTICLPSWIDSTDTDPLPANTTVSLIVDIVAGTGGAGQVAFAARSATDPSQRYEHTFTATVAAP